MSIPMKTIPGYFNEKPGIQVGTKMEGDIRLGSDGRYIFDEQGVRFLKQMGVDWVMVGDVPEHNAKTYKAVREQLEERGLKIYRLQNIELHNMPAVTLGLPDRDRMIDRYLQYITDLGEAGIHYATYAHMGNGIWRGDARREVRGGATAGGLDLHAPNRATAFGPFDWPLSHGRVYGEDEIWENYEYFIKKVVPVAEAAGVYIGIHPDDPPVYTMAGVPRCVFGNFEGYKRAGDRGQPQHRRLPVRGLLAGGRRADGLHARGVHPLPGRAQEALQAPRAQRHRPALRARRVQRDFPGRGLLQPGGRHLRAGRGRL